MKLLVKCSLFIGLLCVLNHKLCAQLSASQFSFSHLSSTKALPASGLILSFQQDKQGFMWVGSAMGLFACTGEQGTWYKPIEGDSNSLPNNFINQVTEDEQGILWISTTAHSLTCFYPKKGRFLSAPLPDLLMVFSIYKNTIYGIIGNKVYCIRMAIRKEKLTINLKEIKDLPLKNITSVSTDQAGNIWYSTSHDGLIKQTSPGHYQVLKIRNQRNPSDKKPTFWILKNGDIISCTKTYGGLSVFDPSGNYKFTIKAGLKNNGYVNDSSVNQVRDVLEDKAGNIWIATFNGLWFISKGLQPSSRPIVINPSNGKNGLRGGFISKLYQDRQGLIWVGTNTSVDIFDPASLLIRKLSAETDKKITDNRVRCFTEDSAGNLLIGTQNGLNHLIIDSINACIKYKRNYFDHIAAIKQFSNPPLKAPLVNALLSGNTDTVYIGTRVGGLHLLTLHNSTISPLNHFTAAQREPLSNVESLAKGVGAEVLVGNYKGLFIYNPYRAVYQTLLKDNFVMSALRTDGEYWVATSSGLLRLNKQGERLYVPDKSKQNTISHFVVSNLLKDKKGRLWISTLGGGLNVYHPDKDNFTTYTEKDGLSDNSVWNMLEDDQGNLWLMTNAGLSVFSIAKKKFRTVWVTNEGGFQNAFFRTRSGMLLLGCPEGALAFYPDQVLKAQFKPTIRFTDVKINYETVPGLNYALNDSAIAIALKPGQRVLSFMFSGLDFLQNTPLNFEYKLVGFDTAWIKCLNQSATYTNLPFGQYKFLVRCSKDGLDYSTISATIQVQPPFWQTGWFLLVSVLSGILIIFSVTKFIYKYSMQKQLHALAIEREIQTERLRISRDLHDNIGSQLTNIIFNMEIAQLQLGKVPESKLKDQFFSLENYARATMRMLRRSIWVLSQDALSFDELKNKILEHATQFLQHHTTPVLHFNSEGTCTKKLQPAIGLNLFPVLQELLTNTVKHSQAQNISIFLKAEQNTLKLEFKDDGRGMQAAVHKSDSFGLRNMKDRIESLHGHLTITTEPGKGTTTVILLPLNHSHA